MGILWDLFGVHIVLISIILLLLVAWLIWPRKQRVIRNWLIRSCGIILTISILCAVVSYWPKSYDKTYLDQIPAYFDENVTLSQLADSIDFYIGIAVTNDSLSNKYVPIEFNSITAENHFKPNRLLKNASKWIYDFSVADSIADIAFRNNIRLRGHTLIWGKFPGRTYPSHWGELINNAEQKDEAAKAIIKKHIETVVGRYKGRISSWDVVNEPMAANGLYQSIFTRALGENYIDYSFNIAHEVDPACKLFLNEAIVDYNGPIGREFLKLLERLIDRDVPIYGVGLQTHHIFKKHDVDELKSFMKEIADLGLKIEITELDMSISHFAKTIF